MGAESSKQQFVHIIDTLKTSNIEATNHEFWDELWKTTLPIDEIFEVIEFKDIRQIIRVRIFSS